jgi:putative 4-mercaptohistidine N1-methyltranferase
MSTTNTSAGGVGGPAIYEGDLAVQEYLQFHFADDAQLLPYSCGPKEALNFCGRCADECLASKGRARALDIGCSVGGQSFALSEHFDEVVGIDFSHAFVNAAAMMQKEGHATYTCRVEADIFEKRPCKLRPSSRPERVHFQQGDACALPAAATLGKSPGAGKLFDAVLASNLLCRLPEPMAFLQSLPDLVVSGGVVVLVSPYSWLDTWTAKDKWLGGVSDPATGEAKHSFPALKAAMEKDGAFELEKEGDMPFLIREHQRKFQWGCSHLTVWRRTTTPTGVKTV